MVIFSRRSRFDLRCHLTDPFFEAEEIGVEIADQTPHHR